jgi:hypothetical protein
MERDHEAFHRLHEQRLDFTARFVRNAHKYSATLDRLIATFVMPNTPETRKLQLEIHQEFLSLDREDKALEAEKRSLDKPNYYRLKAKYHAAGR